MYYTWAVKKIFKSEIAKSNVFPSRKINLKAVNAKGLAAPGGNVRVIVVVFVKGRR